MARMLHSASAAFSLCLLVACFKDASSSANDSRFIVKAVNNGYGGEAGPISFQDSLKSVNGTQQAAPFIPQRRREPVDNTKDELPADQQLIHLFRQYNSGFDKHKREATSRPVRRANIDIASSKRAELAASNIVVGVENVTPPAYNSAVDFTARAAGEPSPLAINTGAVGERLANVERSSAFNDASAASKGQNGFDSSAAWPSSMAGAKNALLLNGTISAPESATSHHHHGNLSASTISNNNSSPTGASGARKRGLEKGAIPPSTAPLNDTQLYNYIVNPNTTGTIPLIAPDLYRTMYPNLYDLFGNYAVQHQNISGSNVQSVLDGWFTTPYVYNNTLPDLPRFIVWTANSADYANLGGMMLGITSSWLLALLMGRVFYICEQDSATTPHAMDAFLEPFGPGTVWVAPSTSALCTAALAYAAGTNTTASIPPLSAYSNAASPAANNSTNIAVLPVNSTTPSSVFSPLICGAGVYQGKSSAPELFPNVQFLLITAAEYFVPFLYSNPIFREQLEFLFPDNNVFSPLANLLFQPTSVALDLFNTISTQIPNTDDGLNDLTGVYHNSPMGVPSTKGLPVWAACFNYTSGELDKRTNGFSYLNPYNIYVSTPHSKYIDWWSRQGGSFNVISQWWSKYQSQYDYWSVKAADIFAFAQASPGISTDYFPDAAVAAGLAGFKTFTANMTLAANDTISRTNDLNYCYMLASHDPCMYRSLWDQKSICPDPFLPPGTAATVDTDLYSPPPYMQPCNNCASCSQLAINYTAYYTALGEAFDIKYAFI